MSSFLPDHTKRLARLVNKPGGQTAAEAVAAAEHNLATLRDRGLGEVTALMDRIAAATASVLVNPAGPSRAELYRLSNALHGIAGVFGMVALGEAAYSLCTLLDRIGGDGQAATARAAIQLHLDSLRLIRAGGLEAAQVQAINTALRQVVERLPAPP